MTANPADLIGGLVTTANVPKGDLTAWIKARVPQVLADATELRNTLLAAQLVVSLKSTGIVYILDAADTTSADDGVNVIVSLDGKRFKPPASAYAAVGQLPGTATNDNAGAGKVGEFVTATAAGVSMTSSTPKNVASIALTAGDWDVEGTISFGNVGATTYTFVGASVSTVSNTSGVQSSANVNIAGATYGMVAPRTRVSLAAPATVYLVEMATFTGGTPTCGGVISARRVR